MDTTYIKMCDCPEIQGIKSYDMGSFYWEPKLGEFCLLVYPHEKVQYGWEKPWYEQTLISLKDFQVHLFDHHAIWLPRQDDLQEMLGDDKILRLHYAFTEFCHPSIIRNITSSEALGRVNYIVQFTSMEQLWLAFVMKEKFNKVWDGERWQEVIIGLIENPDFEEGGERRID